MLLKMRIKKFNPHLAMDLVRVYAFKLVGVVARVAGEKLQLSKALVKKDLLLVQILVQLQVHIKVVARVVVNAQLLVVVDAAAAKEVAITFVAVLVALAAQTDVAPIALEVVVTGAQENVEPNAERLVQLNAVEAVEKAVLATVMDIVIRLAPLTIVQEVVLLAVTDVQAVRALVDLDVVPVVTINVHRLVDLIALQIVAMIVVRPAEVNAKLLVAVIVKVADQIVNILAMELPAVAVIMADVHPVVLAPVMDDIILAAEDAVEIVKAL
jgi:hypothetical protein